MFGNIFRWTCAIIACVIGITLITLPPPSTMIAVDAVTETVQITALNRDEASFRLASARRLDDDQCLRDLQVFPNTATRVTYTRTHSGAIYIAIDGPAVLASASSDGIRGAPIRSEFETLVIDPVCSDESGIVRLPLNGLLEIGLLSTEQYASEVPFVLRSGNAIVYARAVDRTLWGLLPIGWLANLLAVEPGGLFEVRSLSLPAGSQVSGAVSGRRLEPARWWGHSDIDISDASSAMTVRASTNATALRLFAPAPRTVAGRGGTPSLVPETISVAALARITGDPNLQWLYIIGGLLSALAGVIWLTFFRQDMS